MALGSQSVLEDNALMQLFGQGYSFRCTKIPKDVQIPTQIRHFDRSGFSYLTPVQQTITATNGYAEGQVLVVYAQCPNCGKLYYRVESSAITMEYQQTQSGAYKIQTGQTQRDAYGYQMGMGAVNIVPVLMGQDGNWYNAVTGEIVYTDGISWYDANGNSIQVSR